MDPRENLADVLALEPIEKNLYRGVSENDGWPRIFGGLVIAQALLAAYRTVEDRLCHSLHAYFMRPGDVRYPVLYEVERPRDGKSFTTRRVNAIQNGEHILNMSLSFQTLEDGFEHQDPMPQTPAPEGLPTEAELRRAYIEKLPKSLQDRWNHPRPIDMRHVDPQGFPNPDPMEPNARVWFRAKFPVGDDIAFNQAVMAYASDMAFMSTSMRPHGVGFQTPGMQSASLDHAMWFHRPTQFNAWHLYVQDSPSASGGRGFNRGSIFAEDGRLVASTAQEGLIRYRPPG